MKPKNLLLCVAAAVVVVFAGWAFFVCMAVIGGGQ
jgi:hypothetical protein